MDEDRVRKGKTFQCEEILFRQSVETMVFIITMGRDGFNIPVVAAGIVSLSVRPKSAKRTLEVKLDEFGEKSC